MEALSMLASLTGTVLNAASAPAPSPLPVEPILAEPVEDPEQAKKRIAAEKAQARKEKLEADALRRSAARNKAAREWPLERRWLLADGAQGNRLPVLDEKPEETLARLARWSVESEHGDLKGMIHQLLTPYECDLLRGRIAVAVYGKLSQDEFERLVKLLKASNWPQPSALVKIARHVGVLPAQTRGVKQQPVWLVIKEHTEVEPCSEKVTTKRHALNVADILEDQRHALDGTLLVGKKFACGKKLTGKDGKGKLPRLVTYQRLPDEAKVSGVDIFWCGKCWQLYNKQ